jgi:hypothetical protein
MSSFQALFWVMDPYYPLPPGTIMPAVPLVYTDSDGNGFIDSGTGDIINGEPITHVWIGDTVTFRLPDGTRETVKGATFYTGGGPGMGGNAYFVPVDGVTLQDAAFVSSTWVLEISSFSVPVEELPGEPVPPPCLTPGTLVLTPQGSVPVETLCPGDLVCTLDHGPQPVRWIGRVRLAAAVLASCPRLRPVRIAAGALGAGLPERPLTVSPQHRMLLRSRIAGRMYAADEVLVAAVHLTDIPGIARVEDGAGVEYLHLMFDRHEVIFAEGAPTESLYLGPMARRGLPQPALAEIVALFPDLADADRRPEPARPLVPGRQARRLATRHLDKARPLIA